MIEVPATEAGAPAARAVGAGLALDHTKLDVYHRALYLLDLLDRLIDGLPAGRAHLKDQLDHAGTSVVLNIVVSMLTKLASR